MPEQLTNLLPAEREHAVAQDYYMRLAVVALWFVSALIVVGMVLTIPTYVYLTKNKAAKENQLATIETKFSSANQASLSARLTRLNKAATQLSELSHTPAVSALIQNVLAVSRPGIMLSGFSYTPPAQKVAGTLTVSGLATTRDALRGYQLALQALSFVRAADLPVSAYAKDSNIPFAIVITLAP
jgi:hypothetical protein